MSRPSFGSALARAILAALSLLSLPAALSLSAVPIVPAQAAIPAPSDKAPSDLSDAESRIAKLEDPAAYASALDAFSSVLTPADDLALLRRGLDAAAGTPLSRDSSDLRPPLLLKAGDLALLLGLFEEAAVHFEEAASAAEPGDGRLLLRSARCYLAAGDPEKASAIAESVLASPADAVLAASAQLVEAWALLLQGRTSDAAAVAADISAKETLPAPQHREACFLLWLGADAAEKARAASVLVADFPGSPEALIASGAASPPPLPHWYLGGLGPADPQALAQLAPGAQPQEGPVPPQQASPVPQAQAVPQGAQAQASPVPQTNSGSPQSKSGKRLQVGYFSMESNADALRDELVSKRFAAYVEPRTRNSAQGPEKRWIVVVDGGKDLQKTMQALENAGYEAYIVD